VFDKGKTIQWDDFDTIRQRVKTQWNQSPSSANVLSPQLQEKTKRVMEQQRLLLQENMKS
jgi:hypothetical protein